MKHFVLYFMINSDTILQIQLCALRGRVGGG